MSENPPRIVVSDTGALASLERITDGYGFIRKLFDVILVPPAVMRELAVKFASPTEYLRHYEVEDLISVQSVEAIQINSTRKLHRGEIEAISLAFSLKLSLLIEETAGRVAARSLGIPFSGIARQVVNAHEKRLVSAAEARGKLDELIHTRRIDQRTFDFLRSKIV